MMTLDLDFQGIFKKVHKTQNYVMRILKHVTKKHPAETNFRCLIYEATEEREQFSSLSIRLYERMFVRKDLHYQFEG